MRRGIVGEHRRDIADQAEPLAARLVQLLGNVANTSRYSHGGAPGNNRALKRAQGRR